MIAPTFHINILKSFISIFNQNSRNVVENMRAEVGKTFDVHDYMSTVTVDILLGSYRIEKTSLCVVTICFRFYTKHNQL